MISNEQARIASIVYGRMRAAMPHEPIVVRSWQDEESGYQEINAQSMNMMDLPTGAGSGIVEDMGPNWVAGAVIKNIWRENNWTWQQWEDYRLGK